MKEYNLVQSENAGNLPLVVGTWQKIKGVLAKGFDLNKPVVLELTQIEEKVLTEVYDFWFQEIKFPELHEFLCKPINFFKRK